MKYPIAKITAWILIPILLVLVLYCYFTPLQQTTIFFVRHAEKTGSGLTDTLSTAGFERAEKLAFILQDVHLDAVYATEYLRTQQTGAATASDQGLSVTQYTASSDAAVIEAFLDQVLDDHSGGNVLIVGHSNTVPLLVNALLNNPTFSTIAESEFSNLFVLDVLNKGPQVKLKHLHYGD
ncbi:MAG: histidine phosphatase family protein [Phaeodactylibacter sp.]|nr:histidine phosphatase family protein [Phaeodactylibacter sp.]